MRVVPWGGHRPTVERRWRVCKPFSTSTAIIVRAESVRRPRFRRHLAKQAPLPGDFAETACRRAGQARTLRHGAGRPAMAFYRLPAKRLDVHSGPGKIIAGSFRLSSIAVRRSRAEPSRSPSVLIESGIVSYRIGRTRVVCLLCLAFRWDAEPNTRRPRAISPRKSRWLSTRRTHRSKFKAGRSYG
jgi:hypothetical protein